MAFPVPRSVYSLGGGGIDGAPAVRGNAVVQGRVIVTYGAIQCTAMHIVLIAGTGATVRLWGNNGQIDTNGDPPSLEWVWYGDYVLSAGDPASNTPAVRPTLNFAIPYWRADVTVIDSGSDVIACVSSIRSIGQVISPNYLLRKTAIQIQ